MTAFCACRRFSAWSYTDVTDGPSITLVGHLDAPVRGERMHEDRAVVRHRHPAPVRDPVLVLVDDLRALRLVGRGEQRPQLFA